MLNRYRGRFSKKVGCHGTHASHFKHFCLNEFFLHSGPWQLHGSVAGPGRYPGGGDSVGVDGQQAGEGLGGRCLTIM